jgi:predicted transcriptional regulator
VSAAPQDLERISPLLLDILRHTKLCGPDTPNLIIKRLLGQRTGLAVEEVRSAYAELCDLGLMRPLAGKTIPRRYETSSIKKTLKRRAKQATPRKMHTYYELTRAGRQLLRQLEASSPTLTV